MCHRSTLHIESVWYAFVVVCADHPGSSVYVRASCMPSVALRRTMMGRSPFTDTRIWHGVRRSQKKEGQRYSMWKHQEQNELCHSFDVVHYHFRHYTAPRDLQQYPILQVPGMPTTYYPALCVSNDRSQHQGTCSRPSTAPSRSLEVNILVITPVSFLCRTCTP